jgi:hypothetical protein
VGSHGPAVERSKPSRQRESEPEASLGSRERALPLDERIEDGGQERGVDAGARVADPDLRHRVDVAQRDADLAPRASELGRVVQEVSQNLRHAGGIDVRPELFRGQLDSQPDTALLDAQVGVVGGAANDLPKVYAIALKEDLAASDPGHVEQIVYDPRQMLGLTLDHPPRRPTASSRPGPAPPQTEHPADRTRQTESSGARPRGRDFFRLGLGLLSVRDSRDGNAKR